MQRFTVFDGDEIEKRWKEESPHLIPQATFILIQRYQIRYVTL